MTQNDTDADDADQKLLEELAALEHRQWVYWTQELTKREDLPDHLIERWEENWVPYDELDEGTKDHDRKWAQRAHAIFREHSVGNGTRD